MALSFYQTSLILFDLAFFILDMLAHHRVVFTHDHLFGHGTRILFGHVEMARARGRVQTDLDCRRLRHFFVSYNGALIRKEPVKSL